MSICLTAHLCAHCGEPFYPKRTDRVRYCSRSCSHAQQKADAAARLARTVAQSKAKADAKAAAKAEARRIREEEEARLKVIARSCGRCQTSFTTTDPRRAYCGKKCRKAAARVGRGSETHRARARKHGVRYVRFDPVTILERDGWTCQICGIPTPRQFRGTILAIAPELDHIRPLSRGGPHTPENTQCACRGCNGAKADSLPRG